MSKLEERDSLELEVANFGPIAKAKVDLRPLTVFVGPSNTGKSYLAILMYALHRHFSNSARPRGWGISGDQKWHSEILRTVAQIDLDALGELIRPTSGNDSSPDQMAMFVSGAVGTLLRTVADSQGDKLGRELFRCFGASPDKPGFLIRKGQRDASVVLRRYFPNDLDVLEHKLTLTKQAIKFSAALPNGMHIPMDGGQIDEIAACAHRLKTGRTDLLPAIWLAGLLHDLALRHVASPLHCPAFYLPADRTGVMHAHRIVVSALIENASTAGLRSALQEPTLSGVLADFLGQLVAMDRPTLRRKGFLNMHSTQIEKAILGGSVHVAGSTVTGYPHFTYRPDGWKNDLPLMNASSMVSELAPVVLYLRHIVEPDSVLIVEEPESHLHPAIQVEFTRQLVALVSAGVRVIVTTHSEWLLEELANIVRRAVLPGTQRKMLANGRNIALSANSVGAWLFKPKRRPMGSVVSEVRLDDTGLYPTGFDDVATTLHNDWAEISSQIEDSS